MEDLKKQSGGGELADTSERSAELTANELENVSGGVYRITNIRANMTQFSGAALPGTQQVNASVSTSTAN